MKKLRKKVIIYFSLFGLLVVIMLVSNKVKAYSETGHEDFKKIIFVDSRCKLLNEYGSDEIDKSIKSLGTNVFGWRTRYFNLNQKAYYEGITIFSRSNKSSEAIKFDYVLNETQVTETSVTVKGSVSTKITGTVKKVALTFNGEGEYIKEVGNSYTSSAKTSITFNINPNKKLSLVVSGECYVTTAVSRYKFLGITFKKGSWENIEVETIIYEIKEENI